jgi:hypothetical protein
LRKTKLLFHAAFIKKYFFFYYFSGNFFSNCILSIKKKIRFLEEEVKMANFKQIDMRFWQNDFVLGLTPEERYFYMYLVTNTMTTKCGIYKFNLKVAELETGYTADVIDKLLENFESYGKIAVSKSTKEIMIINWFKHNFKNNKRTILEINKELKNIKNKEFIKQLYDICLEREYPVKEIFCGIILACDETETVENSVKDLPKIDGRQETELIENTLLEIEEVNEAKETENIEEVMTMKEAKAKEESIVMEDSVDMPLQFRTLQQPGEGLGCSTAIEEVEAEEMLYEEEEEDIIEGTTIAVWDFFKEADKGERGPD